MAAPELDIGLVTAGHGRHYVVETPEGRTVLCSPRGKKSECVVGDRVRWQVTDEHGHQGVIEAVEPRRSLLYRQDEWRTKSFAANIDRLVVLIATEPVFSEQQLARALIAAEHADIPATIVLNKIDRAEAAVAARARLAPYRAMGCEVLEVALAPRAADGSGRRAPDGLDPLRERLARGSTLVLGPSGTGKSTLVNLLVPDADAQVGEISTALNSGRHTTTHTRWYWLDRAHQSALIDSPGFQEFGLHQVPVDQLARLMPDLNAHAGHCRFANCSHDHEPGCGVLAALARGEIAASRHRIYLALREELGRSRW